MCIHLNRRGTLVVMLLMLKLLQECSSSLFLGHTTILMEVLMGLLIILSLVMEVVEACNLKGALNICHITL